MKKSFVLLALISSISSVFAYDLTIINDSAYDLKAEAKFGGPGICGRKEMAISAGKTYKRDVGGCCLTWLKITTTGGDSNVGKSTGVEGRNTGMGLSCRSNTFRVNVARDGSVIADLI